MEGIGGLGIGIGIGMGAMGGMGGASSGAEGAGAVGASGAGGVASANQSAAPIGNSSSSGNSNSNQSGGPSVMLSISPEGMNMMTENSDLTAMLLMSLMDKASEQQTDSTNGGVLALALVGATAINAYSSIQNMK